MRRVEPKRTASERSAGPSTSSSSASVAGVGDGDVVGVRRAARSARTPRIALRMRIRRALAALPCARAPASSARRRTGAAARSSGERWTLRDDIARPSGSRTVGWATTSIGIARSRAMLPDHEQLLGVLLAEVRPLGADEVEQDRDDRRDAVEVARPGRALERLGDGADVDGRVEARRVDLVDVGREDEVGALLGADLDVARLVARVPLEVRRVAELARVDEDRDDGRRVLGAGPLRSAPDGPRGASPSSGTRPTGRGALGEGVAQLGAGADDAGRRGRRRMIRGCE